jgi:hypothetical protein
LIVPVGKLANDVFVRFHVPILCTVQESAVGECRETAPPFTPDNTLPYARPSHA